MFRGTTQFRRSTRLAVFCGFLASTGLVPAKGLVPGPHNQQRSESASGQTPAGVADKWATVFGMKIHYQEAGSGPAVILLHGLGGDASNWAANIMPLSKSYRVLVPDQIGFGKSDKPLINYRVATLVDFLDGFMKE